MLVRSLLAEIINRQHDMECIGTANDPLIAREMIRELNPDVITLDVEMPRMDGIDFLGRLMRLRPMPVVMISTLTERGAEVTMRALELGAIDFVAKPRVGVANGLQELASQIVDKIRVAAVAQVRRLAVNPGGVGAGAASRPAAVPRPAPVSGLLGRISPKRSLPLAHRRVVPRRFVRCSPTCLPTVRPSSSPSICRRASLPALQRGSIACAR